MYNLDVYVEKPLPSSTIVDYGKVLSVNSSGNAEWATPSGGGTRVTYLTLNTSTWSDFTTAYTALQNGTIDDIRVIYTGSSGDRYARFMSVTKNMFGLMTDARFVCPNYSAASGREYTELITLSSGGTWSITSVAAFTGEVTAGTCVSVTTSSGNYVIALSTTAGITDIQQVAALPASPVATVLYLIPEA